MQSEAIKSIVNDLRALAKLAETVPETTPEPREKLDSNHVMNFLKFYVGDDKGV